MTMGLNGSKVGEAVLKARIAELKSSGAIVILPGGGKAWLPQYETFIDFDPHDDFYDRAKDLLGTEVDVIEYQDPIKEQTGKITVSIIRATNDPWNKISDWEDGEIKVMRVTTRTKYDAIGILSSGVHAHVSIDSIRNGMKEITWQDFATPLVGDEIAGVFYKSNVDEQNRIVRLDSLAFIQSQIPIERLLSLYGQENSKEIVEINSGKHYSDDEQYNLGTEHDWKGIENILLVDNDEVFVASVEEFIKDKVGRVYVCGSLSDAERIITEHGSDLDLAFIDIHIPKYSRLPEDNQPQEPKDHLGLVLASSLSLQYSHCRIILVSGEDEDPLDNKLKQSEGLKITAFFEKPFGLQSLFQAFAAYYDEPKPLSEFFRNGVTNINSIERIEVHNRNTLDETLHSLRKDIDAEAVILYSIHPITYEVQIECFADPTGIFSILKPRLHQSPVRDVAIDGEEVFAKNASSFEEFPKHRWLVRAYNYRSCIGVNVKLSRASHVAHALFAYHRQPNHFDQVNHLNRVKLAAREIGLLLGINLLEDELREMKPFELMGKIYGSMSHELTSIFSDEFHLENLKKKILAKNLEGALIEINILKTRSKEASDILRSFREMARGQQNAAVEDFFLETYIPEIIDRFQKKYEYSKIKTGFITRIEMPCRIKMQKIGIELILFNLLLNADQQIDRIKFIRNFCGEILVELDDEIDFDGTKWAIIKITDNGPGIHKRDFNHIFNIHYTTKDQGCGMGLDISRNIARRVKRESKFGDLKVLRSILLVGTTFELRLPLS
jgi:signal transduction histidine kinase/DNA-binding NarL/FixJ family response regulator